MTLGPHGATGTSEKDPPFKPLPDDFQDSREPIHRLVQLTGLEDTGGGLKIAGLKMQEFAFNALQVFQLRQKGKRPAVNSKLHSFACHKCGSFLGCQRLVKLSHLVVQDPRSLPISGKIDAIDSAAESEGMSAGVNFIRRQLLSR